MPKIKKGFDLLKDGFTQSLFETWRVCPKKARLKMQGYYSPSSSSSLIYGIVLHSWLGTCMELIRDENISEFEYFWNRDNLRKISKLAKKEYEEEMINSDEDGLKGYIRAEHLMVHIIPRYFRYWKEDFFGKNKKNFIEIETEFNVKWKEAGVNLRGKRDGVYGQVKDKWLMEHKGKGLIMEEALSMLIARDLQVNVYLMAYFLEFAETLKGVLYNIIRNPKLYQRKEESIEDFSIRVGEDIDKRPDFYFMRFPAAIPENHQKEWASNFLLEVKQFIEWFYNGPDVEYTHSCMGRYGVCEYMRYCDSRGQDKTSLFKRKNVFPELKGDENASNKN